MSAKATTVGSAAGGSTPFLRKIGMYVGILAVVFLLGLIPMWLKARGAAAERDAAQRTLRVSEIENAIAKAALDASRGEYEQARMAASDFYTRARAEIDLRDKGAIAPARQEAVEAILASRDDIITMLARSDPASAGRLTELYFAYRQAIGSA